MVIKEIGYVLVMLLLLYIILLVPVAFYLMSTGVVESRFDDTMIKLYVQYIETSEV